MALLPLIKLESLWCRPITVRVVPLVTNGLLRIIRVRHFSLRLLLSAHCRAVLPESSLSGGCLNGFYGGLSVVGYGDGSLMPNGVLLAEV